jgi:hypothetical protein
MVYVDGHRLAKWTPALRLPTPPGRHSVKIFNPELKRYSPTRSILIKEGETRVLGFQW